MAAYVRGDHAAGREIFSRCAPWLLRVVHRTVGDRATAEDVVQQAFLQLHRSRADYREGCPLRPWVLTIALNLAREQVRRSSRRTQLLGTWFQPAAPTAGDLEGVADRLSIERALTALSADQREVVVLHWFEGMSFPDIARVVGASPEAVKVRAHRAYGRLRAALSEGTGPFTRAPDPATAEATRVTAEKDRGRA